MQSNLSQISHVTSRLINKVQNEWVTFTYSEKNQCRNTPLKLQLWSLTCAHNKYPSLYKHTHFCTLRRGSPWVAVFGNCSPYVCVFFLTQHSRELSIFIMIQSSVPAAVSKTQRDYTVWYLNGTSKNTMYKNEMKHEHGEGKDRLHGYKEIKTVCWRWDNNPTTSSNLLPKTLCGITMLHLGCYSTYSVTQCKGSSHFIQE